MAADYFCLDVGESLIKIADVKKSGSKLEVTTLGAIPLSPVFFPSDTEAVVEKQAAEVSKLIQISKVTKKNVNIVLPDSFTFNDFIPMPYLKEKEMLSAIRYQADQFIPLPLDEINLDVEVLIDDKSNNKKLTLISAAPKRIVEKVQKMVEYAGLMPVSLETETSAMGRFLSEFLHAPAGQVPSTSGILFINLGLSATSLYFFEPSIGIITLYHNFSRGLNIFLREIMTNLSVDEAKAYALLKTFGTTSSTQNLATVLSTAIRDFVSEVTRFTSLVSEKNKMTISRIYLTSDATTFNAFDKVLERYFSVPTSLFDMYPFFIENPIVGTYRDRLSYFISTVGGNLR